MISHPFRPISFASHHAPQRSFLDGTPDYDESSWFAAIKMIEAIGIESLTPVKLSLIITLSSQALVSNQAP